MTKHCKICGTTLQGKQVKFCSQTCHDKYWKWVVKHGKAVERTATVKARLARAPKPELTVKALWAYAHNLLGGEDGR